MRWFAGGAHRGRAIRLATAVFIISAAFAALAGPAAASTGVKPHKVGMLDCNGFSPSQQTVRRIMACTDPLFAYDGKASRFAENGHYIGHDEPIIRFLSSKHGSGNDVTWTEQLPRDPAGLPTGAKPGHDRTHWFELSVAPWFSMAMCDPRSYPIASCRPRSDSNAPDPTTHAGGGGQAFMEMQFYPPGEAPFVDNISCDNQHWCSALTIDSLECTAGFESCKNKCIEPVNFAWIQRDGVPTGPPSPQLSNDATVTPNGETLMMNPGDKVRVHMFDARLRGGGHAFEVRVNDLTTGRSGFMIASARNGFMNTSFGNCNGHPFNFQPAYDTARPGNAVPWAALETNIATQFEIGHWEPCTSISDPMPLPNSSWVDTAWQVCNGPYEQTTTPDAGSNPETTDAPCYPRGFRHHGHAPPNEMTGCPVYFAGGDIDFDGTSYWPDWPNSLRPGPFPSPFLQQQPTTRGRGYASIQFETDAPASEASCQPTGQGCAVPAPGAPGRFYPHWTQAKVGGQCVWEFGNMTNGNSFGRAAQYGTPSAWFFGNLESPIMRNPQC
jgi:hypothetical protein